MNIAIIHAITSATNAAQSIPTIPNILASTTSAGINKTTSLITEINIDLKDLPIACK